MEPKLIRPIRTMPVALSPPPSTIKPILLQVYTFLYTYFYNANALGIACLLVIMVYMRYRYLKKKQRGAFKNNL